MFKPTFNPAFGPQFGWIRPHYTEKEFLGLIAQFDVPELEFKADVSGQYFCAWEAAKEVTGDFLVTYQQQVGDCVGNGEAQGLNYQQCVEIMLGDWEEFHYIHPSFSYGMSRLVAGFRFSGDGSSASAAIVAAQKYGHLMLESIPYSGELSRRWGERPGPPKQYRDLAAPQLMGNARRVKSYEQFRDAMIGAKCCGMIASTAGFQRKLQDRNGKSWFVGYDYWPHNMALIGCDDRDGSVQYLQSWGPDYHGPQLFGPNGSAWLEAERFDKIVRKPDTECFVFGPLKGWQVREFDNSSIG